MVLMFRDSSTDWTFRYEVDVIRMSVGHSIYDSKKIFRQNGLFFSRKGNTYKDQQPLILLPTAKTDLVEKQSKKVAEQYILGTWFKNGSS